MMTARPRLLLLLAVAFLIVVMGANPARADIITATYQNVSSDPTTPTASGPAGVSTFYLLNPGMFAPPFVVGIDNIGVTLQANGSVFLFDATDPAMPPTLAITTLEPTGLVPHTLRFVEPGSFDAGPPFVINAGVNIPDEPDAGLLAAFKGGGSFTAAFTGVTILPGAQPLAVFGTDATAVVTLVSNIPEPTSLLVWAALAVAGGVARRFVLRRALVPRGGPRLPPGAR
jgi:hypothetical protein